MNFKFKTKLHKTQVCLYIAIFILELNRAHSISKQKIRNKENIT